MVQFEKDYEFYDTSEKEILSFGVRRKESVYVYWSCERERGTEREFEGRLKIVEERWSWKLKFKSASPSL